MTNPSHPESSVDGGQTAAFGPDSGPPLPANGSVPQALAAPTDPSLRYHIGDEIARGGMGAIFKGRDIDLGRDIAVKVLLETHQGKTEFVQRFVEEAQIAGQLQHPGVTPVYELGQFADKRPYFTMKLVKGETLAALLAARPDSASDRARFVGVFAQVCQTLAYAHARGVIHRDLKPANIMVGAFGEVQVMDWGLAKVLKEGGVTDEQTSRERQRAAQLSVIQTQRSEGSGASESATVTQAGSVLGTPAYMAPEQARGAVELVDARADVFGLGALLCEILTGEPPFTGKNAEAMRKAQTAQLDDAFARLDGCGADGELAGLARRCLAAEPWDRPRDAGEVAAAVTAYQNSVVERLRQADLAHAAEVARTEEAKATAAQERKARRLTLGLAACVLALITVGAAGGLWVQRQWAAQSFETLRQRQAVGTALEKASELRQRGRWAEALAVLDQTRDRLGEAGPADLRQQVEQATADLTLVDRLQAIHLKRSTLVEGKFDNRIAEQDYAATFRDAGMAVEGEEAEAVAARIRDSAVGEHLVAALDDWAEVTNDPKLRAWLLETARRADPDPWRDRFRDPKVWSDRASLEALAKELLNDEKQLAKQKPQLLAALASALHSASGDAAPLLAAAQARYPDDFSLNFNLGSALYEAEKWDEAIGFYRSAVAVRPSAAAVHNSLGYALSQKKQLDEAIREFRIAIELDPKFSWPHNNVGNALRDKMQLDEALKEYHLAVELDPKSGTPHGNLGNVLRLKKQLDEAIVECRIGMDLDPKNDWPHIVLGDILLDKHQLGEAIQEYRIAIALDPKAVWPHNNLGNALQDKQQLDAAIQEYRIAVQLDPKIAFPHIGLGNALRTEQHLDDAIQEYRIAIDLDPDFPDAHNNLGATLLHVRRYAEARDSTRRGLGLLPPDDPLRPSVSQQLQQCEQLLAVEQKLAVVLEGKDKPADDAERLALAHLCREPFKKLYAASCRFYSEAFANDTKLADEVPTQARYNAACVAALAGRGQGADADKLDDKERVRLRKQAVEWLRADLAYWTKQATNEKSGDREQVRQTLKHWQEDADLSGLRDAAEMSKLPAEEQEACKKLWADVQALLDKADAKK
jgi:tetratricopeptide (TPR) repeat protein